MFFLICYVTIDHIDDIYLNINEYTINIWFISKYKPYECLYAISYNY